MKKTARSWEQIVAEDEAERAAIKRDLDDISRRNREGASKEELNEAIRRARLRLIRWVRGRGGLALMMQPYDKGIGGNVVQLRRRP